MRDPEELPDVWRLMWEEQIYLLMYKTQVWGELQLCKELEATIQAGCVVSKVKVGYSSKEEAKSSTIQL